MSPDTSIDDHDDAKNWFPPTPSSPDPLTLADAALYERIDALLDEHAANDAKRYHAEHCAAPPSAPDHRLREAAQDYFDHSWLGPDGLTATDFDRRAWESRRRLAAVLSEATPGSEPALNVDVLAEALHETAIKNHNLGEGPLRSICDEPQSHIGRATRMAREYLRLSASQTPEPSE